MSKLIKNWSYLLASDIVQQIVGFVVVIFLARKLSPDGYGLFNVIISIATIFSVLANFGMANVIIRELSLKPELTSVIIKKIILPIRLFSLVLAVIAFIIYNNLTLAIGNEWILYVVLIVLNLLLWDFSESIAFGHEVTKFSSLLNIIIAIVWLFAILLIPSRWLTVQTTILIYCILHFTKAFSYVVIVLVKFYKKSVEKFNDPNIDRSAFLKMVLPYVWLLIIAVLGNQLPIQFLNNNSNLNEVGYYAVGFKLMVPISIAVGTAFRAIFPSFTKLYASNKHEFQNRIKEGFNLIIIIGTLIAIISSITSQFWLPVIFGESYKGAVLVFNFLIWFSVISILDTLLSNGLSSAYKEKTLAILATLDILILLPLLYYSSQFGAYGLAVAKLGTGLIFLAYHLYVFIKILKINLYNKTLIFQIAFYIVSMIICLMMLGSYQIIFLPLVIIIMLLINESPLIMAYDTVKHHINKFKFG
jgi:O-antigen/teichoic acid export membrane protein